MYVVILAGGGGTRLRPLSRDDRPKPFLPLLDERTLIQQTVDRLRDLPDLRHPQDIYVVTHRRHADLVRAQLPSVVTVIEEPQGRNTAAAIALATIAIERRGEEVMLVLPADHAIEQEGIFDGVLRSAARHLATGAFGIRDPLVTLGIQVNRPATEYGYLRPDIDRGENVDGLQAYPLQGFEEKPTADRAQQMRDEPGVAWNAGMFLWRRRAILRALNDYTTLVAEIEPAVGDPAALARVYAGLPPISIDYAVMEPAARDGRVVMAAMDVGWNDIGGWTALLGQIGASGSGRVLQPGEAAEISADDLAIVVNAGRLVIHQGPSTIRSNDPAALLSGAAAHRGLVDQMLTRVRAKEAQKP